MAPVPPLFAWAHPPAPGYAKATTLGRPYNLRGCLPPLPRDPLPPRGALRGAMRAPVPYPVPGPGAPRPPHGQAPQGGPAGRRGAGLASPLPPRPSPAGARCRAPLAGPALWQVGAPRARRPRPPVVSCPRVPRRLLPLSGGLTPPAVSALERPLSPAPLPGHGRGLPEAVAALQRVWIVGLLLRPRRWAAHLRF
jgi:hypothetical protein